MWMWRKGNNEAHLFECGRNGRFRSDWKGVLLQERESRLENILGYKRVSERLERVTLSMLRVSGKIGN